jgi:hypothetical protein
MAKIKPPKRPSKTGSSEGETWVAPSARVFTDWTPSKLRSAQVAAESGNLTQAVAVCDWLLTDDAVDAGLDSLCDALFGLVPTFEPSGDKRRSNRAVKALEAGEDFWKGYPEAELRLMLRWGYLLGLSLHRHAWQAFEDHGNRLLPMLGFWHPGTLQQNLQTQEWTVNDQRFQKHVVTPGDGEWVLHTPFGRSRPWAMGKWNSLKYWVLLKHYARFDWARHGEKAATLVATSSKDNTDRQRRELAQDLQDSGSDRIVALQVGFDLKMVEVTANTRDIYLAQIEAADSAIAILLRGGNLTTKVESGSRAAAETQAEHGDEPKLRFNAESISTTLHDQSLSIWALFNFSDTALAPWPVYPVEPEEDLKASADTINVLGDGVKKLDDLGFIVDEKQLIERFRLDFIKGRKSPEERAKEAADRAALQPAPGGAPVQPGKPAPGKTPAPKKDEGKALADSKLIAMLASGDTASSAPNFIAGQLYVDDVVASAAKAAGVALDEVHTAILEELDACTSIADFMSRMRDRYKTMDSSTAQEITYRVMLMSELAGRFAVTADN